MKFLTTITAFLLAAATVATVAEARHIHEMEHGFIIPCQGELCLETLFCWRGARYADLNQATKRVRAVVNFSDPVDTCVEAESDDILSLRTLFGSDNHTAAIRLTDKIGKERGWVSSMILRAFLGEHRVTGDGECTGSTCTLQFSPYGQSCIRLCSKPKASDLYKMHAEVYFESENAVDVRTLYMWAIGFALASAAPALSQRPEMFYITGGTLGVVFAVALLVLIISRMTTRTGPTKNQLGVAAMFQFGVVYMRKAVFDFVKSYIDWIALYVVVTFVSSLALVHYFLTGEDGRVRLTPSLKDIVRTALQLLGAFFIAAPVPSARYRFVTMAAVFAMEVISSLRGGGLSRLFFGTVSIPSHSKRIPLGARSSEKRPFRDRTPEPARTYADDASDVSNEEIFYDPQSAAKTPSRQPQTVKNFSGGRFLSEAEYERLGKEYTDRELRKLLTPSKPATPKEQDILDWVRQNHTKMFVRKDDEQEEEEEALSNSEEEEE